mmetsp:Transcript_6738/g.7346  ORF Transcript_6738/g.7346 Transcript_6738/m.7346 type:complete len:430 (-) Transcript_6738:126-1415(-)
MNQANQKVVIQEANMNLVQIRTFELDYFSTFFSNFGTQSALMIGFIAGSVSQVPGYTDPTGAGYFWEIEYWVTSALCLGCAIACLISAFFILVFGQGLAIRGPEGSMIKTIEGMIIEQHYIVMLFCLTLFFFGLQCMGMYYLMFDTNSALVTTIITGLAIIQGYREALRLYNRFFWGDQITTYFDPRDTEDELNDLDPSLVNDLMSKRKKGNNQRTMEEIAHNNKNKKDKRGSVTIRSSVKNPLASFNGDDDGESSTDEVYSVAGSVKNPAAIPSPVSDPNANMYGAYITMKDRGKLSKEEWLRRYILVRGHLLYYYYDKRSFELNPAKPINKRAIDLEGYTLVAGSSEAPYPITLIPYDSDDIRKVWKFRCDTSGEFERWLQLFSVALQSCNPSKQQGDLVIMADGRSEIVSVKGENLNTTYSENDER